MRKKLIYLIFGVILILLILPAVKVKGQVRDAPCGQNQVEINGECYIKIGGECVSHERCVPGAECVLDEGGKKICQYIGYGEDVSKELSLPSAIEPDVRVTIIRIINYILSFLAIIGVIMIIIGGLTWATAGGNEEKVGKAKKTILSAVIGLAVVLLAWVIVNYIITIIQTII